MIRGIVFDLDGTLLDHDGSEMAALSKLYPTLPRGAGGAREWLAYPDFVAAWHAAAEEGWHRYVQGEFSFAEQRAWRVRQVLASQPESESASQSVTDEEVHDIFARYLALYEESWVLYPDAKPCLAELAAFPLGVITNGDGDQQRRKLRDTGVAACFRSVVISGDVGVAKPHREIFDRSAAQMGLPPDELLFIGDNPHTDVQGALGAGWHCVWLNRLGLEHEVAARTVAELTAVPPLVLGGDSGGTP